MEPTPPAQPTVTELTDLIAEFSGIFTAIAAVFVIVGVIVFGAMLLRASRYPWPVPIIAPIAMLSLVFGLAGLVTTELIPLAGAGIGALAGVLTSQLGKPADPSGDDDTPEND